MRRAPQTVRASARLALAFAGSMAIGACAPEAGPQPQAPRTPSSILLVTLDTTRADALGCYGGGARTPALDRLASEGVLFERAHTVAPITLPAHASMLTGLYPLRHGVRDNGAAALAGEAVTLAELALEGGYQTAAFLASIVLAAPFGLDQGFEVYETPRRNQGSASARAAHGAELPAASVIDNAITWLEQRDRARPFLLWVHCYDPHHPYEPPPGFTDGDPYHGEIAAVDAELRRLFDALEREGELASTTVLVVSDHGEAFGEHDETAHATFCYQPTLQVPLILRAPLTQPGTAERSRALVSVADVFPTLVESMGLESPAEIDGRSLWTAIPEDRGIYFETYYGYFAHGWSHITGFMDSGAKYVHSSAPELFDWTADPGEVDNLFAGSDGPERAAEYVRALDELDRRPKLAEDAAAVSADLLEDIQSLGYAGMTEAGTELPGPTATSQRPAPRHSTEWFDQHGRAFDLVGRGQLEQAAEVYVTALEANPLNHVAVEELGNLYFTLKRYEKARSLYGRLCEHGPQLGRHYHSLGLSLMATGQLKPAHEALERAIELSPESKRFEQTLRKLERRLESDD